MKYSISQLCKLSRVLRFLHQYSLIYTILNNLHLPQLSKWFQHWDGTIRRFLWILFVCWIKIEEQLSYRLNLAGPSLDSSIRHSALPLEYCCQHQGHCCVAAGDGSMDTLHRYPHPGNNNMCPIQCNWSVKLVIEVSGKSVTLLWWRGIQLSTIIKIHESRQWAATKSAIKLISIDLISAV